MYDEESYCATPIEQFFIKREQDESHLSIEQQAENQVLVKADYIAHIHQPPYPILGKFRELKLSPIDYAILYDLRKEVYGKEHKFHNSTISEYRDFIASNDIQPPPSQNTSPPRHQPPTRKILACLLQQRTNHPRTAKR